MTIPITSTNFSLHYSGSFSAMDLTCLDAFVEIAEHTRIKSGSAQEAAFEIDVTAGQAHGRISRPRRENPGQLKGGFAMFRNCQPQTPSRFCSSIIRGLRIAISTQRPEERSPRANRG